MKPTSSLGPELVPPLVVSVVVAVAHSVHKLAALCVGFRTIARQIFFCFRLAPKFDESTDEKSTTYF